MRKLGILLVPLLLLACTDRQLAGPDIEANPTFSATSEWTVEVMNLPYGDDDLYCAAVDDFFDEVGPVEFRYHSVSNKNGFLFFIKLRFLDGYHMVADRTGNWYLATDHMSATFVQRGSFKNGTFTFTINQEPFKLESEESGTIIRWPFRLHFTFNAGGDPKVLRIAEPCTILGN